MSTTLESPETRATGVLPVYFPVSGDWRSISDPSLSGQSSTPVIQTVSGLVLFTPRLPKGTVFYVDNFAVSTDTNEVQTIYILGSPTSGNYILMWEGPMTNPIDIAATAATIQTELEALSSIGAGNVAVAGNVGGPFTATFQNALGNQQLNMIGVIPSLSGAGNPTVTVEEATQGSSARAANAGIAIPPRQGRIWSGQLCSIDQADSPNALLMANDPMLGYVPPPPPAPQGLLYDVLFSQLTYNNGSQYFQNFAFMASVDQTPVCITDKTLERFPYQRPMP